MDGKQKVNDKCNCKSGKKYKKCCMNIQQNTPKKWDSYDRLPDMVEIYVDTLKN
jgi:hypothetical protein